MNSDDGAGTPASGRDEPPPPPPTGAGGSSKGWRSASVDDGPPPATKSRASASVDGENSVESGGTVGVLKQANEAARASKQYEKVPPPLPDIAQVDGWLSSVGDAM
eukprot:7618325-Lingulodinium_polyedra.AAC.1